MPKIIENPEQRLIREARRQLEESGYSALTIRSVAKACGVGVGTVYNYFPSKDALVATYMLDDWKRCVTAIETVSTYSETPAPVLHCMYDQLVGFSERHRNVFRDDAAEAAFAGSFSRYHALLRSQLSAPIRKFCESDFASEFIAEAILTWTMSGKTLDEICTMLNKLF